MENQINKLVNCILIFILKHIRIPVHHNGEFIQVRYFFLTNICCIFLSNDLVVRNLFFKVNK